MLVFENTAINVAPGKLNEGVTNVFELAAILIADLGIEGHYNANVILANAVKGRGERADYVAQAAGGGKRKGFACYVKYLFHNYSSLK